MYSYCYSYLFKSKTVRQYEFRRSNNTRSWYQGYIIPAGEEHIIPSGTIVTISQALGCCYYKNSGRPVPNSSKDWDALGDACAQLKKKPPNRMLCQKRMCFLKSWYGMLWNSVLIQKSLSILLIWVWSMIWSFWTVVQRVSIRFKYKWP